jgi:hypothetical protein
MKAVATLPDPGAATSSIFKSNSPPQPAHLRYHHIDDGYRKF